MKRCLLFWSFFCIVLSMTAFAEEQKYVVRLEAAPISLYSEGEKEIKPLIEELYMYEVTESRLEQLEGVIYAAPAAPLRLYGTEVPKDSQFSQQWNLDMIQMPQAWRWRLAGEGIRVAIIDSGINESHADLKNRIVAKKNYTGGDEEDVTDKNHHGTLVAGIIAAETDNTYGIAGVSQAELVALKVVNGVESNTNWLIEAIGDAVDEFDCDVINLSLGFTEAIGEAAIRAVRDAMNHAMSKGAIVVAAVGNYDEDKNAIRYPAAYDWVTGVAGVDSSRNHVSSSVVNETVDLCAPGKDVLSAGTYTAWTEGTGTSFATPHVAGAAAILKGINPDLTSAEFEALVTETAAILDDDKYDPTYGWGLLDLKALTEAACKRKKMKQFSRVFADADGFYADFRNYSGEEINGNLFWGSYQKNGRTDMISFNSGFLVPDGDTVRTTFTDATKDTVAKVMFFENLSTLTPLCPFGYQDES